MYKGSYAEALEAFFRSLSINEALGNNAAIPTVSGNIATVYYRLKDYTRSLEYGRKALQMGPPDQISIFDFIASKRCSTMTLKCCAAQP